MSGGTGYDSFDTTVDKTNRLLHDIEREFGWSKTQRNRSYAALRAVLHALRDRLPVDESSQLAAQLPMLVRGIYYDGWDPSRVPVKMHRAEFEARVRQEYPFEVEGGTEHLITVVLNALQRFGTTAEWADVKGSMPKQLAELMP